MGYVWTHLDIIKDVLGCLGRDTESPTIPRYSVMRVFGVDIGSKLAKIGRVRISTHETDAGNVAAEPGNELIQHFCRQWSTYILPKELAVTPRTWLLYTSDAADEQRCVEDGCRHVLNEKDNVQIIDSVPLIKQLALCIFSEPLFKEQENLFSGGSVCVVLFKNKFLKDNQLMFGCKKKTSYEVGVRLEGWEKCIRDSPYPCTWVRILMYTGTSDHVRGLKSLSACGC